MEMATKDGKISEFMPIYISIINMLFFALILINIIRKPLWLLEPFSRVGKKLTQIAPGMAVASCSYGPANKIFSNSGYG